MKTVVLMILFIGITLPMNAQDSTKKVSANLNYRTTLSAFIGQKHGLGSSAFFEQYVKYFGGANLNYPISFTYGASIKMELLSNIRFGINSEHFTSNYANTYVQKAFSKPEDTIPNITRSISQKYSFSLTPLMLSAEYTPVASIYRTYFGAGIGAAFGKMEWTESVNSSDAFDKRTGGTYFNETVAGPAGMLYAGVELGFDRTIKNGDLFLLTAEARYTIIGISKPLFAKAVSQFTAPPAQWSEPVAIGASGISLQLGIAYQFSPR